MTVETIGVAIGFGIMVVLNLWIFIEEIKSYKRIKNINKKINFIYVKTKYGDKKSGK